MSNLKSAGDEWSKLKQAYEMWDSLESNKKAEEERLVNALKEYNDSCNDWDDELDRDELSNLLGDSDAL